jgi:hypothetical protein
MLCRAYLYRLKSGSCGTEEKLLSPVLVALSALSAPGCCANNAENLSESTWRDCKFLGDKEARPEIFGRQALTLMRIRVKVELGKVPSHSRYALTISACWGG